MILLLDNYDSFTYNVADLFAQLGEKIVVKRNDEISLQQADALHPDYFVVSPGPSRPENAGICISMIKHFLGKIPILGVCLGHQALAVALGGKVIHGSRPVHGKTSAIYHNQQGVFHNLANPFTATRYHSLVIAGNELPDCLTITAHTQENEIMGICHNFLPAQGVQFHPESILTEHGEQLLRNFLAQK